MWHIGVRIVIATLIVGVALSCIVVKVLFCLWLIKVEKNQGYYLNSLETSLQSPAQVMMQVNVTSYLLSTVDLYYYRELVRPPHHLANYTYST